MSIRKVRNSELVYENPNCTDEKRSSPLRLFVQNPDWARRHIFCFPYRYKRTAERIIEEKNRNSKGEDLI